MSDRGIILTGKIFALKRSSQISKVARIIKTGDGSHTIYVPHLNEHYHSVFGAVQESTSVYINNGFDFCIADPVNILEIGFGTGLNAFLTALRASATGKITRYTTIEKYPLPDKTIQSLNYRDLGSAGSGRIFDSIHLSSWGPDHKISNEFTLRKIEADFTVVKLSGSFDLIYYDAFGPEKQPEMWTREIFFRVAEIAAPGSVLVTYSAKGEIQRHLRECGFAVTLLPGPPGKRHVIRAVKIKK